MENIVPPGATALEVFEQTVHFLAKTLE